MCRDGLRGFLCPRDDRPRAPEQEQSGAETFLLRQLRKNGFSVNTDVPEEEKEQQREV